MRSSFSLTYACSCAYSCCTSLCGRFSPLCDAAGKQENERLRIEQELFQPFAKVSFLLLFQRRAQRFLRFAQIGDRLAEPFQHFFVAERDLFTEVLEGHLFFDPLENFPRESRVSAVGVRKESVQIGGKIFDGTRQAVRQHVHGQRRRIKGALDLTADQPVQAEPGKTGDVPAEHFGELQPAQIAVDVPHQMIIEIEAIPRKTFFPAAQEGEIHPHVVRVFVFVADIGRKFVWNFHVPVAVRLRIRTENGRKHHHKAVRISDLFRLRRPVQVEIDEKDDLRRKPFLRQARVDVVEHTHIQIGNADLTAVFAFADVVEIVRKPEMQHVDLRMFLGVADDFGNEFFPHVGARIAKVGVEGHILEELALSPHLCEVRAQRCGHFRPFLPARGGNAETFARPPVSDGMDDHAPLFQFGNDPVVDLLRPIPAERLRGEQGIVGMRVPAFKELVPVSELDKIAVQPRFGHPVDELCKIFFGYGALDGNAAVIVCGAKSIGDIKILNR